MMTNLTGVIFFFLIENSSIVQKGTYGKNCPPSASLMSQFPSPEIAITTNFLCIHLERVHACTNMAPLFCSMRPGWIFLTDSWVCHSLSRICRTETQSSNRLSEVPPSSAVSSWGKLLLFAPVTLAYPPCLPQDLSLWFGDLWSGHSTWVFSPLVLPSQAPSGLRLHTTSSEGPSWLPSFNRVLHCPLNTARSLWSIFLTCAYISVYVTMCLVSISS